MDMITALTIIGTGIGVVGFIYSFLRNFKNDINSRIDKLDSRIDKLDSRIDKLENKVESVQHTVNDIDKRLYGVETVLHMKDCCVLKQDQNLKKAE